MLRSPQVPSLTIKTTPEEFKFNSNKFNVTTVHGVVEPIELRPVEAFKSLQSTDHPAFISESRSPEKGASRYSYICPTVRTIVRTGPNEASGDLDPIETLRKKFKSQSVSPIPNLPALITGAFGFIAYEAISHFEPSLKNLPKDPTDSPVSAFTFPGELLVFDHELNQIHIIIFSETTNAYHTALDRISEISRTLDTTSLANQAKQVPDTEAPNIHTKSLVSSAKDKEMVNSARNAIIAGELIQVVLGRRITTNTSANPLDIYEQLTTMNPSPYMYLIDLGDIQLIGASPELMLRSKNNVVSSHPIAGTRPRGSTAQEDLQNEADLISNEKETAEHVMLVDLARNDLGRVCKIGSVKVQSLKHVERYSHVMHLVSRIEGKLSKNNSGLDAFKAGFPIGTLSGAPKLRAIQLIANLEMEGRGPYCGGIGWFGQNGDVDTGTFIRSIILRDGVAHVQGGAGIVFDSDPNAENLESLQKVKAPLLAIASAEFAQSQRLVNDAKLRQPVKVMTE